MASAHSDERPLGSEGTASHHMRNSPPIQPDEPAFPGKLPSFSEFLSTTQQSTPPRTPKRGNGSTDASPPQFEEVAWSDVKRRRVDSHIDILSRPSVSYDQGYASRRPSSLTDVAGPAYYEAQPALAAHHHRPSMSYQPPMQTPAAAPQGIPSFAPHSRRPSVVPAAAYAPTAAQHPPAFEQRPAYYPEHTPAPGNYAYDRPQEPYYGTGAFGGPAYEQHYGDIRFHQHLGSDQNAFSRKRRGNLPKEATNLLKQWYADHKVSPYPTEDEKQDLSRRTGLSLNQVSNWFINARRRAGPKDGTEREAKRAVAQNNQPKNGESSNQ